MIVAIEGTLHNSMLLGDLWKFPTMSGDVWWRRICDLKPPHASFLNCADYLDVRWKIGLHENFYWLQNELAQRGMSSRLWTRQQKSQLFMKETTITYLH